MPRHARFLLPNVPHHVTQRGNRRENVFFSRTDRLAYLQLLRTHVERYAIEVVAYCLMPNHVHLILIPADKDQLHCAMRAIHGQYAQRINRIRGQTGHVWQGRYFSSPLDSTYFVNAVRYVELNPVRARLVAQAEDYDWSSAAAHCGLRSDLVVQPAPRSRLLPEIASWSRWLSEGVSDESLATLRKHSGRNLPCGSPEFVAQLEKVAGRSLRYRAIGRDAEESKGDCPL